MGENSITATFVGGSMVYRRKDGRKYTDIHGFKVKREIDELDSGDDHWHEGDHVEFLMQPGVQEMHDAFENYPTTNSLGKLMKAKRSLSGHRTCGCAGH